MLKELVNEYLVYKKPYIKHRTYERYTTIVKEHLGYFDNIAVANIDTKTLQKYIDYMASKKYSKSTISMVIVLIKSSIMFNNPNKHFEKLTFPKQLRNIKVYTEDEVNKIMDYICTDDYRSGKIIYPHLEKYIGILILIFTGMRMGEALALTWNDIHFDEDYISVTKSAYYTKGQKIITAPKSTSSIRQIPLFPKLKNYLKIVSKNKQLTDSVIISTRTNKEISNSRNFQHINQNLCKQLGVEHKGIHAYRHYFATHLIRKSGQVKLVSECLGHSNIMITQNIYNNPSLNDKLKLGKYF